jgi:hypothetical protein
MFLDMFFRGVRRKIKVLPADQRQTVHLQSRISDRVPLSAFFDLLR